MPQYHRTDRVLPKPDISCATDTVRWARCIAAGPSGCGCSGGAGWRACDAGGHPGLRDTTDEIEAEGVRRARARAAEADLVIRAEAASTEPPPPPTSSRKGRGEAWTILVANKVDLGDAVPPGAIAVSALIGEGLATLRGRLAEAARSLTESTGPPLTQARHLSALQEAAARLAGAQLADLPELRAEDLRFALRALGRITGSVGVEDILDTLFARFCIGK